MLRVYGCVFCSISLWSVSMSLLFDYLCMRLPFIPWSIAGVPSSQVLPGFLITAPPPVLVPAVLGALAVWIQTQKKIQQKMKQEGSLVSIQLKDTRRVSETRFSTGSQGLDAAAAVVAAAPIKKGAQKRDVGTAVVFALRMDVIQRYDRDLSTPQPGWLVAQHDEHRSGHHVCGGREGYAARRHRELH